MGEIEVDRTVHERAVRDPSLRGAVLGVFDFGFYLGGGFGLFGDGDLFGGGSILVRAYPEFPEADRVGRTLDPRAVDDALRRAERDLHQRAEKLGRSVGRPPRLELAAGDPAVALLQEAREEDGVRTLIAVGTRGLGPAKRLRLGSVSTKVLRAAEGPVLVCPPDAA